MRDWEEQKTDLLRKGNIDSHGWMEGMLEGRIKWEKGENVMVGILGSSAKINGLLKGIMEKII